MMSQELNRATIYVSGESFSTEMFSKLVDDLVELVGSEMVEVSFRKVAGHTKGYVEFLSPASKAHELVEQAMDICYSYKIPGISASLSSPRGIAKWSGGGYNG